MKKKKLKFETECEALTFQEILMFPPGEVDVLASDDPIGDGARAGFLMREGVPQGADDAMVMALARRIRDEESEAHAWIHGQGAL